jgi:hypothetical protein
MDPRAHALFASSHKAREQAVQLAVAVADLISAVEAIEAVDPSHPELAEDRREVEQELARLRTSLEDV